LIVDLQSPNQMASHADYHLHKEQILVEEVNETTHIQVICSSNKDVPIYEDVVKNYFSNPALVKTRNDHAMVSLKSASPLDGCPVYIVTYSSPEGEL